MSTYERSRLSSAMLSGAAIACVVIAGCAAGAGPLTPTAVAPPAGVALSEPRPWSVVTSPLAVVGCADPGWFFEGSCGVRLVAADGSTVATRYVRAGGEASDVAGWRRLSGSITFDMPEAGYGSLVLTHSSADTGYTLREFQIPVRFREYE